MRFNPGGPLAVGKQAIEAENQRLHAVNPDFKVLKYTTDIKEIQIVDDWAIEVGNTEATYKMSAKDDPVSFNFKGMRLLKRQSDGSWKFALVGWRQVTGV